MRIVRAVVWVALIVVGSVAAAGLVLTLDHRPTDAARPELFARDAAILAPRLIAIEGPLVAVSDGAQALAEAGQGVLVRLRGLDLAATSVALATGDRVLDALTAAATEMRTLRSGLLNGLGSGERLSAADRARVAAIAAADAGVDALAGAWADIDAAASAPVALLTALHAHDQAVVEATDLGRAERYPRALVVLDGATDALAHATTVRDDAQRAGRDVAALDAWLGPLARYDDAVRALYRALLASASARTPQVEAAIAAEAKARAALPGDRDGLAAAVADIGAADITPALLTIDDARGAIEAALEPGPSPASS